MSRFFLCAGAISGFISVAIGAFGAHALKNSLTAYSLGVFDTATQYHMLHSMALLVTALLLKYSPASKLLSASGYAFLFGIVVFSGSLYTLAISELALLGAITPIGGIGFLTGWSMLAIYGFRSKPNNIV